MFISLKQLEQRPVRFKAEIPAGEIEYDNKVTQESPLHTEGTAQLLSHALSDIRVQGSLQVTMTATCDRCLDVTRFPVEHRFDLVYMPAGDSTGGEKEVDESAIEVGFYDGNGLELNDVLREIVLLALPMQLVCNDACQGICPVCGQNRNQGDCGCQQATADDRWNGLKKFRAEVSHNN